VSEKTVSQKRCEESLERLQLALSNKDNPLFGQLPPEFADIFGNFSKKEKK
jgi:hypothetical protein